MPVILVPDWTTVNVTSALTTHNRHRSGRARPEIKADTIAASRALANRSAPHRAGVRRTSEAVRRCRAVPPPVLPPRDLLRLLRHRAVRYPAAEPRLDFLRSRRARTTRDDRRARARTGHDRR